jgi:hypothetical protein
MVMCTVRVGTGTDKPCDEQMGKTTARGLTYDASRELLFNRILKIPPTSTRHVYGGGSEDRLA